MTWDRSFILENEIAEGFFSFDRDFCISKCNRPALDTLGFSSAQNLLQKPLAVALPEWEKAGFLQSAEICLSNFQSHRFELTLPESQRVFDIKLFPEVEGGLCCVFRDISEERKLGEEYFRTRKHISILVEASPVILYQRSQGPTVRMNYVSDNIIRILGWPPAYWVSNPENFETSVHKDDTRKFRSHMERLARGLNSEAEYRLKRQTGDFAWVRDRARVIRPTDKPEQNEIVGVLYDVTEMRQSREALEVYARAMSEMRGGFFVYKFDTPGFVLVAANPQAELLAQKSLVHLVGSGFDSTFPFGTDALKDTMRHILGTRESFTLCAFTNSPRSGEPGHYYNFKVFSIGQNMIGLLIEDVTAEIAAEMTLVRERSKNVQQAKMAVLGEMSAGVAHEINNPLMILLGRAERLLHLARQGDTLPSKIVEDSVRKIDSMAQRIGRIVKSLRFFARDGDKDPFEIISLQDLIHDTLDLCSARMSKAGIQVSIALPESPVHLQCRPVQISQVLLNILNNAVDAVSLLSEKWITLQLSETEDEVEIRIIDSGRGIPRDIVSKMMNPFFTTKAVGEGTGLGLSISRGIMESHRGHLRYDEAGKNTAFILTCPKRQASTKDTKEAA